MCTYASTHTYIIHTENIYLLKQYYSTHYMYGLMKTKIFVLYSSDLIYQLIKYVFPIDVFLPTPDSLLVNLYESKEVRLIFFLKC